MVFGWYRKMQDWLQKKERNQRRSSHLQSFGRRRRRLSANLSYLSLGFYQGWSWWAPLWGPRSPRRVRPWWAPVQGPGSPRGTPWWCHHDCQGLHQFHDEGCLTIHGFANGISWFGCYLEEDSPKESGIDWYPFNDWLGWFSSGHSGFHPPFKILHKREKERNQKRIRKR